MTLSVEVEVGKTALMFIRPFPENQFFLRLFMICGVKDARQVEGSAYQAMIPDEGNGGLDTYSCTISLTFGKAHVVGLTS